MSARNSRRQLARRVAVLLTFAASFVALDTSVVVAAAPIEAQHVSIATPVTDMADVLSPASEDAIAQQLVELRARTGIQMAVLTVDRLANPIEDFSQAVFERWGGGHAQRDDGILFVLAVRDRRNRLHLGYGLEPLIADATARRILRRQRTYLRAGNYAGATQAVVEQVAARTRSVEADDETIALPWAMLPTTTAVLWLLALLLGVGLSWRVWGGWGHTGDLPPASRSTTATGLLAAIVCVGMPIACYLMLALDRFAVYYLSVYLCGVFFGLCLAIPLRRGAVTATMVFGMTAAIGCAWLTSRSPHIIAGGPQPLPWMVLIAGVFAASLLTAVISVMQAIARGDMSGGNRYSGDGYTYSSSGSSHAPSSSWSSSTPSSSYSSSSSSSSYSSSSSGASSTSWSGGGGSSGGGGASSSW